MNRILSIFAAVSVLAACEKVHNGVEIITDDGIRVRVEAVTEDIFHVRSVPEKDKFSSKESLVVIPQKHNVELSIEDNGTSTVLATSKIKAVINNSTGFVSYYNKAGELLSAEDSRTFNPITVDGDRAWTVHQTFSSSDDEGFFGLGQHQADEWNYKGKNEDLFQYNTKISVPFIVSSKNYGILWDSYSFCRWGDPREYAQLGDVFTLYDKDGVKGALTGTYVPARGETLVRREESLSQEFLETPACQTVRNAPKGFRFAGANVCFEGAIEPNESGIFNFYLYYAGYTKVYIDGELVIPEIWRTAWNPNARKFALNLEKGKKVPVRIEWQPDGGVSYCGLRVLSPVDAQTQGKMSWWSEMQRQIDYYFINGDNIDGVISGYRTLTGKAQIMPKWTLGYWQSRERYVNQYEVVGSLKEFRKRGIPVDNMVQDWQFWKPDQWGSHEFDPSRFPEPKAMVDSIHNMGGRFMISVWPKFYRYTEHFKELDANGWIYQQAIRDSIIDWIGYEQSFYDPYCQEARDMFWGQMKEHLYSIGVDAWWMDASEPNIRDCTDMDYRKALCGPTAIGSSTEYFNTYSLLNAQAIYEGQRSTNPDDRVFLLTRSGFAGLQRYSTASWSGDIGTRWEEMKAQISAGLNYSISGIPFWGQDIGGFTVENRYVAAMREYERSGKINSDLKEWSELQMRWHQWGVFCPLYRAHGQYPYREPWLVVPDGSTEYKEIVKVDKLRYTLMPYIYTLAARAHFEDYTLMRPLVMDFTNDPIAMNIGDQFMFGDAFLVCPVYEYGARSREVYLPEGKWYGFFDGKVYEGGKKMVADAPVSHIPVFVRDGQIYPEGELVQSTAQAQTNLKFNVFGGSDASYCLYEDEGTNYNYEKGMYSNIPITWDSSSKTLSIAERQGSFPGMPMEREFTFVLRTPDAKCISKTVKYDGKATTISF